MNDLAKHVFDLGVSMNRAQAAQHGPADYYRRCDERRHEAQAKLDEAVARGADRAEILRLQEAVLDAGNTGD